MKGLIAALTLGLLFAVAPASLASKASGLRGTVYLRTSPTCHVGTPCKQPAKQMWLKFWRNGRIVKSVRTNDNGKYRITLAAHRFRVTSLRTLTGNGQITPQLVTVRRGRYRRVNFTLDIGIR